MRTQKERRSQTRVIETDEEPVEYKAVCPDARVGSQLQKMLGSVLAGLVAADADPHILIAAVFRSDIEIETMADVVMPHVYVGNESLEKTWPYHFANDWAALDAVIMFSIEVFFGNFTDRLPRLLARYLPSTNAEPENARG